MLRARRRSLRGRPRAAGEMPLGSGALAGLNWDLDRDDGRRRARLRRGRRELIDAVSNRDFALDYLYAATDLRDPPVADRLRDRALVEPASSASASPPRTSPPAPLMPQKKNPDAAELLRAKSPRVAGC